MDALNAWLPVLTSMAATIGVLAYLMKATRETLDAKIDGVASKFDAKIDGVAAVLGAKLDHIDDVTDRRLSALEVDVTIVKQRLIGNEAGANPRVAT